VNIKQQARIVKSLRKRIIDVTCIHGCTECCGPVPMTLWELRQMGEPVRENSIEKMECIFKSENGCSNYEQRPIICRVFGTMDKSQIVNNSPMNYLCCNKQYSLTSYMPAYNIETIMRNYIKGNPFLWLSQHDLDLLGGADVKVMQIDNIFWGGKNRARLIKTTN